MRINKQKLKRQEEFIDKWLANGNKGSLEASTGFGKTHVGILIIQKMLERKPGRTTFVVVPTLNLKSQWEKEIKEHNLKGVTVSVINSAVKLDRVCSLLILDEIHNYASEVFGTIFQKVRYKFILGLTATMERADKKHYYIEKYCPVIDRVDLEESVAKNFVSDFKVFNLAVELSESERAQYDAMNKEFHRYFAVFAHNFDTAMLCLNNPQYRAMFSKQMKWEEKDIHVMALQWMRNMQKRKRFLYIIPGKALVAAKIISQFPLKTITFSETVDFVDEVYRRTTDISVPYHSKLKAPIRKENIAKFEDPDSPIRVIHTAKALDEGFNVEGIECAIICSGTSSARQNIQRMGRSIRFKEGKTGIIINLYVPDTQDEKWLRKKQKSTPNIFWVASVAEIKTILDPAQGELPFAEAQPENCREVV